MSWVTTKICWYFHYSCRSKHLTSHACALLIDNVGNYLYMYLNNGSFKSEVDPHQFNLRERKKIFKSWQVCDWLAKWLIVLGFMDLRWPRVYRRSNVGLVVACSGEHMSKWHYNMILGRNGIYFTWVAASYRGEARGLWINAFPQERSLNLGMCIAQPRTSASQEIATCSYAWTWRSETKILDTDLHQCKHETSVYLFWLRPSSESDARTEISDVV